MHKCISIERKAWLKLWWWRWQKINSFKTDNAFVNMCVYYNVCVCFCEIYSGSGIETIQNAVRLFGYSQWIYNENREWIMHKINIKWNERMGAAGRNVYNWWVLTNWKQRDDHTKSFNYLLIQLNVNGIEMVIVRYSFAMISFHHRTLAKRVVVLFCSILYR